MSIWLQKSVLIQPRTSLPKFLRRGGVSNDWCAVVFVLFSGIMSSWSSLLIITDAGSWQLGWLARVAVIKTVMNIIVIEDMWTKGTIEPTVSYTILTAGCTDTACATCETRVLSTISCTAQILTPPLDRRGEIEINTKSCSAVLWITQAQCHRKYRKRKMEKSATNMD